MEAVVSVEWLLREIGKGDLVIVDATAFLPDHQRDARAEYLAAHIPGALFLDLSQVVDKGASLPMMLPTPQFFADHVGAMGIGDGRRIVVYDNSPIKTAARGWWMFRIFGAADVAVLDGGLAAWKAAGGATEAGDVQVPPAHFTARFHPEMVRDMGQVRAALESGSAQILDARGRARFTGEEKETRPGLRSGHMPGAVNLTYSSLYDAEGRLKDEAGLRAAFADAGVDLARPIITSCGSGVTAAVLALGLEKLGVKDVGLYDGSWTEWGAAPDTPVATGN